MLGMGKRRVQMVPLEQSDLDFGKRLAEIRKKKAVTQVELAKKLGTVQGMISAYEKGRLRLNAEMIIRFSTALGVSTDELLGFQKVSDEGSIRDNSSLRIYKRLKKIEALSPTKQRAVLQTLDLVLQTVETEAVS